MFLEFIELAAATQCFTLNLCLIDEFVWGSICYSVTTITIYSNLLGIYVPKNKRKRFEYGRLVYKLIKLQLKND